MFGQFYSMPRRHGEPTKSLKAGSEALREGVFAGSSNFTGGNTSPTGKCQNALASIALWLR